jgi:hypothetical protein
MFCMAKPRLGSGEKSQVSRPLDLANQPPLVSRRGTGNPPRQDLAVVGHEALENLRMLVIDGQILRLDLVYFLAKVGSSTTTAARAATALTTTTVSTTITAAITVAFLASS